MVSTFIGNNEVKLDDKGRFFIPAQYRKILSSMDNEGGKRVVLNRDLSSNCLVIYPEQVWNQSIEQLYKRINPWKTSDMLLFQQYTAGAEYLEIDAQGRILIPKRIFQQVGITSNELLIVGAYDRFAIWDKQTFESKLESNDVFAERIQERMTDTF